MREELLRTRMVYGEEALKRLEKSRVAVFGLGGVGGYAAEALARSGVGALDLIDHDRVSLSNLNRQILALRSTVGQYKVDVAAARAAEINPDCRVRVYKSFYLPETAGAFDFAEYDYIVDAVDTVTAKLDLAARAWAAGTPIISAMGTGGRTDPAALREADVYETSGCPLARVMRRELRRRGVPALRVVYSPEEPVRAEPCPEEEKKENGRPVPGSTAFVPAAAGLILAARVVNDLTGHAAARKEDRHAP